ncbi:chemotaxis protein CheW [Cobetia sp. ICG0124]|uniref:chemotaxis protein CheW n=1 Tax=Cobetia sp. ICG0124 TaxID=2053669 RepID=UPI000FD7F58E|nr:chemotaxis protein CheW [Cobetia sp. ICG0124]AZV31273.1 hypothetical protein CU110_07705 [Cobetia sp. ICG0124]
MDISEFYDTFFEEARELLAEMEKQLLALDVETPDAEQLNAIFRAAHSIKGGAATFGFSVLQETTHHLENLLDHARRGELVLRAAHIDRFLETKDMLEDQLEAYRNAQTPDPEAYAHIVSVLKQLAEEGRRATDVPQEHGSIRVGVDKVDTIINLVGELIITQSMLEQTACASSPLDHAALVSGISQLQRNARDLQEAVMSVRMMPMDYVFSRFPRLIRDLAGRLGKQVELVSHGHDTELDKSLIERIIDPLTHLVRNSLDHGIELPDVRQAQGKSAQGTLTLSARHQGGNIVIEVMDDGAGLDRARILAKARSHGMAVDDGLSDDEVWQLIFAPGFSTAQQVSDVSGRGVGMDVVKRNIQAMGGHVELASRKGSGTTTRIVLPLTLAILEGMAIRAGEEIYILPLSAVVESLQPTSDMLFSMVGSDRLLKVREEYLGLVALYEVFDVPGARTRPEEGIVVVVQGKGRQYALLVDELIGQQQVVVKNLEKNYRKVPGVSSATILGDGRVSLILDVHDLHRLVTPSSLTGYQHDEHTVFEHPALRCRSGAGSRQ